MILRRDHHRHRCRRGHAGPSLAPSGKRILLLERGDWLAREPENWDTHDVFVEGRYVSPDTWYGDDGKGFQPQVHYFVGGATKLYGAALYRFRAEDFGEIQHHDGDLPRLADQLRADGAVLHRGRAAVRGPRKPRRGSRPIPAASAPYPFPALEHEPRIQQLADDLAKSGHHPFHAPCGVRRDAVNVQASVCVRCGRCDGFPCPLHAKSDAEVFGVRPALEH